MRTKQGYVLVILLAAVLMTGCAGGRARNDSRAGSVYTDREFSATGAEAQERLKEMMREQIQTEMQNTEGQNVPVIQRRPYYFREYAVYPDGPEGFTVEFREIDSRTRPLMAEVQLNKIRYSTRMHRKYNTASEDTAFLRDTGVETIVFEWHNGRWTRTGAIFDARTTEEQIDGQWLPRREETVRVNPAEDQPGFFGRIWTRIRGGE